MPGRPRLQERLRRYRQARCNTHLFADIELSGLLAISFVLLIVFLMLPIPHGYSYVDLWRARHSTAQPNARKEDAIIITVTRDGTIYFRNSKTAPAMLPNAIRDAVRNGAERKVYVDVDSRVRYMEVEPVIDAAREAGIWNVALMTNRSAGPTK